MIALRYNTLGKNPPEKRSARRRPLYLTKHTTHKRQTTMPSAEFEHTILASEGQQTHALDRAATGTDLKCLVDAKIRILFCWICVYECVFQLQMLLFREPKATRN